LEKKGKFHLPGQCMKVVLWLTYNLGLEVVTTLSLPMRREWKLEFCYVVSWVTERYMDISKVFLISVINFCYNINKLVILVYDSH
jgi:hypothetical protein